MPHPMRNARFAVSVLLLAVVSAGVACTGGTSSTASPSGATSPAPTSLSTVDIGKVQFVEGEYSYENDGVTVGLTWKGDEPGTLKVENGSDGDLQAPGLYAVTASDQEIPATVADAATIPQGDDVTLRVTFPSSLKPADAGLIVLEFGDQNWGALSPVIQSEGSATPSP
jgi:hypothetical protein